MISWQRNCVLLIELLKLTAMISYYDFKNMPDQAQCSLAINEGRIMNETTVKTLKYILYEVSYFTVEVIFNTENNKIEGMNVFQNKGAYSI
jgi:uncharacterized membrane protein